MKITIDYFFFLAFLLSLLLVGLCAVISQKLKSKELLHLTEFWLSMATMSVFSYFFSSHQGSFVIWGLAGWIWPIKTGLQVVRDMSGAELYGPSKILIPGLGGLLTLILAAYHFPFMIASAPFCLSIGVLMALVVREIAAQKNSLRLSFLGQVTYFSLSFLFLIQVFYPFWRLSEIEGYVFTLHFLALMGMAASAMTFFMEVLKDRQEKHCETVLKERNDQFVGQSKYSELGMMAAGIAHEINNPLAIIQAKTTQLLRIVRDPNRIQEVANGLEQILYTSDRINRTIQGVREFVHQDENLTNDEFSIQTLVNDVLVFCGQRMKNHGVSLRFYGLENCKIRGHKIQLEQVLLNLLNNSFDAIEFLPEKWIEISVSQTENSIQIYVKDSGHGIPQEIASRMMDAFYTTKEIGKGTGLGLAMARGIVEKHGGTLMYIGNAPHTTFMFELPKVGVYRPFSNELDQGRSAVH